MIHTPSGVNKKGPYLYLKFYNIDFCECCIKRKVIKISNIANERTRHVRQSPKKINDEKD